jgi:hypothetical protein
MALVPLIALLVLASPAAGYPVGGPGTGVTRIGPDETPFDWSEMACGEGDIPDSPARAFRDSTNRVQLTLSHDSSQRMTGPNLNALSHGCEITLSSFGSSDPATFDNQQWIHAPYTLDGNTVYALLQNEYYGWQHPGMCTTQGVYDFNCNYQSVTMGISTNRGDSYTHSPAPTHLVAMVPYQYVPDGGPYRMTPTNILFRQSDGYYYAFLSAEPEGAQQVGTCVMRTQTLSNPTSWRAWDGSGYNVRFINPYVETSEPPAAHVCTPVVPHIFESVSYSTYFGKYLAVGQGTKVDPNTGQYVDGIYYSLSDNLVNWSVRKLVVQAPMIWTRECDEEDPVAYASLLDPESTSRNFETTGQRPYLYLTRFHYNWCDGDFHNRDLIRIPIEFSDQVTGGPTARFSLSANPAATNQAVTFDASASSDPGGSITKYEWDLDGNGTYETDTGTTPTASRSYSTAGAVTVWLRVTDNSGNRTTTTRKLVVANAPLYAAPASASSLSFSLVPNFRQCLSGANGQHSAPFGVMSCVSPVPFSPVARIGGQSVGSVSLTVQPGDRFTAADEADISINVNMTDVRSGSETGADYNPNVSGPDMTFVSRMRLTDYYNGATQVVAGTATETDFAVPVDCVDTTDTAVGATCGTNTTAEALMPGFAPEGKRTIINMFRARLNDAGVNGVRGDSDDKLFAQQGYYVP